MHRSQLTSARRALIASWWRSRFFLGREFKQAPAGNCIQSSPVKQAESKESILRLFPEQRKLLSKGQFNSSK